MMLVQDLVRVIDESIDLARAASWDQVGLQIGDPGAAVGRVGVCHELTPMSVNEVIAGGINTVVAYHPLLFSPTTSFVDGPTATGRALRLAVAGVSVIVVHTAFDAVPGGMADALSAAVGVEDPVGFGCEEGDQRRCIGRIGKVQPVSRGELAAKVADVLETRVRTSGDPDRRIETVAVVPGSGGSFVAAVPRADVLITGDVKHHEVAMATENGMAVIDAGHIPTERPGFEALYDVMDTMTEDTQRIGPDPYPWKD
jgi:dinuclear metal center YbgI/SA1388 family protein